MTRHEYERGFMHALWVNITLNSHVVGFEAITWGHYNCVMIIFLDLNYSGTNLTVLLKCYNGLMTAKHCHICIKNVITERMTLNGSCHKHAWNLLHIHDMCHVMIMKVSCQSYTHPFKYCYCISLLWKNSGSKCECE